MNNNTNNNIILMLPDNILVDIDNYLEIYQANFGAVKSLIPQITDKSEKNYFIIIDN
jgi:hypothetical protein